MRERFIFLDMDGVLENEAWRAEHEFTMDPKALLMFGDFLDKFPCSIIISSTWRLHPENELLSVLADDRIRSRIVGKTGYIVQNGKLCREDEILEQVEERGIRRWIAIDDDVLNFGPRFFEKTNQKIGLTSQNLDSIVQKFESQEEDFS